MKIKQIHKILVLAVTALLSVLVNTVGGYIVNATQEIYTQHKISLFFLVGLVCIIYLVIKLREYHGRSTTEFLLFKVASELEPEDFGFVKSSSRVDKADLVNILSRPFDQTSYFTRFFQEYSRATAKYPDRTWSESEIVEALEIGHSVLIIGIPTEGKTRTAYEMIKRVSKSYVVIPRIGHALSSSADDLLAGKDVLCFFDDLNELTQNGNSVVEFYTRVRSVAARVAVVATCRDGIELQDLKNEASKTPLQRLYEGITYKLRMSPASVHDLDALKSKLGIDLSKSLPTFGSVTLSHAFDIFFERFERLEKNSQTVLWCIQLLTHFWIDQINADLVAVVSKSIFHVEMGNVEVERCHDVLSTNGYLESQSTSLRILPKPAFSVGPEASRYYRLGRGAPDGDASLLCELLLEAKKLDFALLMANSYWSRGKVFEAQEIRAAIATRYVKSSSIEDRLFAQEAVSAAARGFAEVSEFNGAVAGFRFLISTFEEESDERFIPLVAKAFFSLGLNLLKTSRIPMIRPDFEGSIGIFDELLKRLRTRYTLPDTDFHIARALMNKGVSFGLLGMHQSAKECFTEVIDLFSGSQNEDLRDQTARALANRTMSIFYTQGRRQAWMECERVFELLKDDSLPLVKAQAAKAMLNAAEQIFIRQVDVEKKKLCFIRIIETFQDNNDEYVRTRVAFARLGLAKILISAGDRASANRDFLIIEQLYRQDFFPSTRSAVAQATINRVILESESEADKSKAIENLDSVVLKYKSHHAIEVRAAVVLARVSRAGLLAESGLIEKAKVESREIIAEYANDVEPNVIHMVMRAQQFLLYLQRPTRTN